jgi:hypothetical protein
VEGFTVQRKTPSSKRVACHRAVLCGHDQFLMSGGMINVSHDSGNRKPGLPGLIFLLFDRVDNIAQDGITHQINHNYRPSSHGCGDQSPESHDPGLGNGGEEDAGT